MPHHRGRRTWPRSRLVELPGFPADSSDTAFWEITPGKSAIAEPCRARPACSRGCREGPVTPPEVSQRRIHAAGSPPLMRWISPLRASFTVLRRSGTNGRRSASRFDLARRIRIAMLLPARFCSYSSPLSMVTKISKPALSARSSREPFFLPARPASGTVWHS